MAAGGKMVFMFTHRDGIKSALQQMHYYRRRFRVTCCVIYRNYIKMLLLRGVMFVVGFGLQTLPY